MIDMKYDKNFNKKKWPNQVDKPCSGSMSIRETFLAKRHKARKDIWNMVVWFVVGYGIMEAVKWVMGNQLAGETIQGFFLGAFVLFVVLTVYGGYRQKHNEKLRNAAMEQFQDDLKVDQDKQANIDKEIIEQLRHEHELSGSEQDKRLKALEAALKHLRGK